MVFLDWLLKYWLQVLFGLICAGVALFYKRIKAWRAAYKKKQAEELKDSIIKEVKEALNDMAARSDANDKALREEMDIIKAGLLSVQGDSFKAKCREALREDNTITIEQFEALEKEHTVYNGLGGNHTGDELFNLVKRKVENLL